MGLRARALEQTAAWTSTSDPGAWDHRQAFSRRSAGSAGPPGGNGVVGITQKAGDATPGG